MGGDVGGDTGGDVGRGRSHTRDGSNYTNMKYTFRLIFIILFLAHCVECDLGKVREPHNG